jgi:hypothetical protein
MSPIKASLATAPIAIPTIAPVESADEAAKGSGVGEGERGGVADALGGGVAEVEGDGVVDEDEEEEAEETTAASQKSML